ncbi:MAG TPA: amino acid ABC transporter substrate-binding protein [Stellaceae bacterium]|nr:amino acid ABC transporter substrate-binding protein [Stellaceae bacterium]
MVNRHRLAVLAVLVAVSVLAGGGAPSRAVEPIRIGFSDQLTGSQAPNGRGVLLGIKIWQEEINAKGGLLGRPVVLDYYDDQSNPALGPSIYTKLMDLDKVDLLYSVGTYIGSTIMPIVIRHNMVLFSSFALEVNAKYHYDRYFQTLPYGPHGRDAISRGFFEAAMTAKPRPRTVALVGSDTEFSHTALVGARGNAQRLGLKIVYDRTYPPATVDFDPIVRVIKEANPDLVFLASYTQDSVGMIRAANEIGLNPKVFGGAVIGLPFTAVKALLGPMLNGLLGFEVYVHEPTMNFPGIDAFLQKYQVRAKAEGVDLLGYYSPVMSYATFQVIAQAVEATHSLDQAKIAAYAHKATFKTIMGDIRFGPDGEWVEPRVLTVQYRHVHAGDPQQFTKPGVQVILWPPAYKSGDLLYPYDSVRK